ncbi:MAG: hypothetical protein H6607_12620 [Flavobacteriales bacterium]|nr:hypothetical protein [Flavobacteriales bacterium]
MRTIIKQILVGMAFLLSFLPIVAQNSTNVQVKSFPSVISSTTALEPGKYVVSGNNVVKKDVTLIINAGTELVFTENASIQVLGGLKIAGASNNFVKISSIDDSKPGFGFEIKYESNSDINVQYAEFTSLKKSLKFDKFWLRNSVNIENSMFHDLNAEVYLEILEMDKILVENKVVVNIKNNTFGNNSSSLMIADAAWTLLEYNIENNVFSRSEFIGKEQNGIFTTPLYLVYNEDDDQYKQPTIKNNSISYNYVGLLGIDTVDFIPVYITAVGSSDKIDISNNYYGPDAEKYIELNSEQIKSLQRAPFIVFYDLLEKPDNTLNGHIYQIGVNGVRVDNPSYDLRIDQFTELIELIANKPIKPTESFEVNYIYIHDDTIRRYGIKNRIEFEDNSQRVKVFIEDKIVKQYEHGYIEIKGLQDNNGFLVPAVNIGLKNYLNKNREFLVSIDDYQKIPRRDLSSNDINIDYTATNNIDTGKNDEPKGFDSLEVIRKEKYWDLGLFTGSTIYFGDLAYTAVGFYIPNARPNVGLRFGYNISERWRIELAQNNLRIAGDDRRESDLGKNRGPNFERGLHFRTTIYDIGLLCEFRLLKYKRLTSYVPSFTFGVSGFYFNPQSNVGNKWYNLRPVGTEGQTLNGATEAYSKYAYSIPMGIKISRHLKQNWIISGSYTYHKLFMDYLDDVSTGEFPDADALKAVNPDLGDIAVQLSNPNGISGRRSFSDVNDGFSYFGITITRKLRMGF